MGRSRAMKMNSAQIERTLEQFEGEVVPEDNPVLPLSEYLAITLISSIKVDSISWNPVRRITKMSASE
jgi:hypothetical protein